MTDWREKEAKYFMKTGRRMPLLTVRGEGTRIWDDAGREYLDFFGGPATISLGHCHPRILAALEAQARRLAVPSRAYHNDRLGPFLQKLCIRTTLDAALPMNTGAEAVETAIKAARRGELVSVNSSKELLTSLNEDD